MTSWMTSSPQKNIFSSIIWDDLFISDIKLKLHVIFWHFQYGRHFDGFFFLPEEISEVNHNRTMSHNQCCISFLGGGGALTLALVT